MHGAVGDPLARSGAVPAALQAEWSPPVVGGPDLDIILGQDDDDHLRMAHRPVQLGLGGRTRPDRASGTEHRVQPVRDEALSGRRGRDVHVRPLVRRSDPDADAGQRCLRRTGNHPCRRLDPHAHRRPCSGPSHGGVRRAVRRRRRWNVLVYGSGGRAAIDWPSPSPSFRGRTPTSKPTSAYGRMWPQSPSMRPAQLSSPGLQRTPAAIAAWLARLPGLVVTPPVAVEVGGLEGVMVDLSIARGWTSPCGNDSSVSTFTLPDAVPAHASVLTVDPKRRVRYVLLEIEGPGSTPWSSTSRRRISRPGTPRSPTRCRSSRASSSPRDTVDSEDRLRGRCSFPAAADRRRHDRPSLARRVTSSRPVARTTLPSPQLPRCRRRREPPSRDTARAWPPTSFRFLPRRSPS